MTITVNIPCLVKTHQRTFECHRLSEGICSLGFNRLAYERKGHAIDKCRNKCEGNLELIKFYLSIDFRQKFAMYGFQKMTVFKSQALCVNYRC